MVVTRSATKKKKAAGDWSKGTGVIPGRDVIGPLFLMTVTPIFSIVFFHVCSVLHGDFVGFCQIAWDDGILDTLRDIWPDPFDPVTIKMIATFMAVQLVFQRFLPGDRFEGNVTPQGNVRE